MSALRLLLLVAATAMLLPPTATASVPTGGRAWELITPPGPVGGVVDTTALVLPSANRLLYTSLGPMPGGVSGDLLATNLAVRTSTGWQTEPIGAPYFAPEVDFNTLFGIGVPASNQEMTAFVFSSRLPLLPAGPAKPRLGLYRAGSSGLSLVADLGSEGGFGGASADTGHIVFHTSEHLLPADAARTSGESIYESVGATLRLVDVADDGSLLSDCGGSSIPKGGVSTDGNRIFFLTAPSCTGPRRLFLREAGTTTTEVSASHCTRPDCDDPREVSFAGATPDGSTVFLTTEQQLVNADENTLRDLYRFDVESGEISLVSPGDAAMEGSVVDRPVLTTADGARTYFRAEGGLLPGEGPTGARLYLTDEAGLRLVAPIGLDDLVQISADGRIALMEESQQLVSGDEDEAIDVYRYDASTGALTRLSAGSGGGNGPFDARIQPLQARISMDGIPSRAMSADGGRVFFGTAEPLVAEDHNAVLDVYEWSQGALGLVSSGTAAAPADFASTSRDGDIVVFRTSASLLPRDRDGGDLDLYAARVGGGFDESSPPPDCSRCGIPSGRLTRARPASAKPAVRRVKRIRLRPLGHEAGRQLVRTGGLVIDLAVPAPGRVSAEAQSVGSGDSIRLAHGVAGAIRPGVLRLRLLASAAARRQLVHEGFLRFRLRLRQGPLALSRVVVLRLEKAR